MQEGGSNSRDFRLHLEDNLRNSESVGLISRKSLNTAHVGTNVGGGEVAEAVSKHFPRTIIIPFERVLLVMI